MGRLQNTPVSSNYKQGKAAIPLTSGTVQLVSASPCWDFPGSQPQCGSRGQCIPVAAAPDSPTAEPTLVITAWKSQLGLHFQVQKHPNLPRLPTLPQSKLKKVRVPGNGANGSLPAQRPTSFSSGQQPGALPTGCIKQQVPGVEVPAQYTLLVKSL